jgi:hypothetical protein
MKDTLLFLLALLIVAFCFLVFHVAYKPEPKVMVSKLCTIKLNDANNQTSYLTGESVE